jgi:hypothetical protein
MFRVLGILLLATGGAVAGEVTGAFRLAKETFCVGEPILVDFTVANGGASPFSFEEGGDYRGTLRHSNYSFRVCNAEGRDFGQELWGNLGGLGTEIKLKPGQRFRSWQLLNGWVHLLPPGKYRVHCERRLGGDKGITVRDDLPFEVIPYSRERILSSFAAMHAKEEEEEESDEKGVVRFFVGLPDEWAIADLDDKFATGVPDQADDRDTERLVLAALPETWDDRYFIAYDFEANRNWLTPGKPEEFRLTLRARNNGTAELPHRLAESSLSVNGVAVATWPDTVRRLLAEKKLGERLSPGAVAEISGTFNEILPAEGKAAVVWTIDRRKKIADVRVGQ